ncbi:hypothetical protein CTI14_54605, partial [Methylobacterium radiotolerans]
PVSPFFDTAESAVRPPVVSVEPDHGVPPFVLTREVALIAAIAGASLLGVLGILINRDDVDGWGFIRPSAAIQLLPDPTTRGPVSPFFDTAESAVRPPVVSVEPDHGVPPFVLT